MMKTRIPTSPQVSRHGLIQKQNSDSWRSPVGTPINKTNREVSFIKAATMKVVRVFKALLVRRRKAVSGEVQSVADKKGDQTPQSSGGLVGTLDLSLQDIYKATANFSPANIIGEGGFGTVYKGILSDGTLVAIKRVKKDLRDVHLPAEFRNEVLTLSKIEHLNLVRLYGYLEHGEERIILVEYVANGTLREHLDGMRGEGLEIAERLDIAVDVAHAVTYLHMYTDHPIIHRDIKSTNILLTEKLRAKVSDFGFARLGAEDPAATHISTQVKGTAGYLDPEYLRTYQLTDKSDVYSFGVLLVEMITGRQAIETKRNVNEKITVRWAMQKLKSGDPVLAMDPRLRRSPASVMAVEKVLKLARQCVAPSRQSRPPMKKCAEVLWRIRKDLREVELSQAAAATAIYHSENVLERDGRGDRNNLFGFEDGNSYGFRSA